MKENDLFNELYEILFADNEESAIEKARKKRADSVQVSAPVLLNFLENDAHRLELINNLLTKIIPNLKSTPQLPTLVDLAEKKIIELEESILQIEGEIDSPLQKNLAQIFDRTFHSGKL